MENLLNPVISAGPTAFLLGLALALVCGVVGLIAPGSKRSISLLRYVLAVIAVGAAAFITGTGIGIVAFCSTARAGNLCGLGGVFGTGPLLAGISVAAYACLWLRRKRAEA